LHNINQFYKSITRFWRNVAFVSLFAIVSACDAFCGVAFDCGCIEADDFGEFQQFIITIKANGTDGSCDFDNTKGVSDDSQGAGLNRCLTQKPTTIDAWTSPKDTQDGTPSGCAGFDAQNGGIVIQQQCISSCIQECQINRLSASASAEPYWEQTSPTFTISPGHEIIITATGSVSLAEGSELGPFFVKPNNFFTHTKNPLGSDNMIADVQQGGEKSLRFQGAWSDEKDSANDNTDIGPGEIDYFSELDFTKKSIAYNGVRRLIAYVEPHPEGYKYSSGVSDEKLAVTGVPFRADVDLWKCNYDVSLTEK
jgi:hypothetical protein